MSVASALVAGNDPLPALAEEAFGKRWPRPAERQANGVLLFPDPGLRPPRAADRHRRGARGALHPGRRGHCCRRFHRKRLGPRSTGRRGDGVCRSPRIGSSGGHRRAGRTNPELCRQHFPVRLERCTRDAFRRQLRRAPRARRTRCLAAKPSGRTLQRAAARCPDRHRRLQGLGDCSASRSGRQQQALTICSGSAAKVRSNNCCAGLPPEPHHRQAKLPLASLCAVLIDDAKRRRATCLRRRPPIARLPSSRPTPTIR